MLDIVLALLAGLATVAAPCTLPVLPILLGASIGRRSASRPVFIALGFIAAFAFVSLALVSLTRLIDFDPGVLRSAATAILLVLGLTMIWPAPYEWAVARLAVVGASNAATPRAIADERLSGLVLGATLGLVWTPCAGPVLGSILTVIATSPDTGRASLLLLVYALGAAIPMLAIAYGGQTATARARSLAPYAPRLRQAFGMLVIAIAVVTYLQYDAQAVAWLAHFYPNGRIGL
jgi:cytochrome c biogenesis protein CcdA